MQEEGRDVLTPSPSKETYSRKVFIGGLPPDIDEGKNLEFFIVIITPRRTRINDA